MATSTSTSTRHLVAVFPDRASARQAVDSLRQAGFDSAHINVLTNSADDDQPALDQATDSKVAEGSALGAAAGAGVGALWALGIAAAALPPLGLVVGGPLIALLASAGTGATVGTVVGALAGLGVPAEDASFYENELKSGRTVVTVDVSAGREADARAIFNRYGGYDSSNRASASSSAATRSTSTASVSNAASHTAAARTNAAGDTLRLHEEQLHVSKQPVQTGEVQLRKEVITEHKTIDVPVTREEVVIERKPVHGVASSADIRPGETIRVPVKEEQVQVSKTAVVTEEVSLGKRAVTETERVAGDVRREEARVEKKGEVEVHKKDSTGR